MIDPGLLAGTPFRSRTAYEDMLGTIAVIHAGLTDAVTTLTGIPVVRYSIDPGEPMDDVLDQVQAQNLALSRALGIDDSPDLEEFDLRDESQWVSWTLLVAQDLTRIKIAAGVI
mgnify:CR=1 FL=1